MIVIRPIERKDAEAFIKLSFAAGIGMTSMPKKRDALLQRIDQSEKAFLADMEPKDESYLFVLEDLKKKEIGGVCGITSKTGLKKPLHFYKLEKTSQNDPIHNISLQVPLMRIIHYYDAPSEICSLYLAPEYRREGLGRLLSLTRFLFVAAYPNRFDKILFAEMRGYVDKNLDSPFWNGLGRNFFNIEFKALMQLIDEEALDVNKILPIYPIYVRLLPKKVQETIGKIHFETRPALNMLIQEGFHLTDEIDVIDGGPKIEVETKDLYTIKMSVLAEIVEITTLPLEGPKYILCNNRLHLKACYTCLLIKDSFGVIISAEVAKALELDVGDMIRYVKLTQTPDTSQNNS